MDLRVSDVSMHGVLGRLIAPGGPATRDDVMNICLTPRRVQAGVRIGAVSGDLATTDEDDIVGRELVGCAADNVQRFVERRRVPREGFAIEKAGAERGGLADWTDNAGEGVVICHEGRVGGVGGVDDDPGAIFLESGGDGNK